MEVLAGALGMAEAVEALEGATEAAALVEVERGAAGMAEAAAMWPPAHSALPKHPK